MFNSGKNKKDDTQPGRFSKQLKMSNLAELDDMIKQHSPKLSPTKSQETAAQVFMNIGKSHLQLTDNEKSALANKNPPITTFFNLVKEAQEQNHKKKLNVDFSGSVENVDENMPQLTGTLSSNKSKNSASLGTSSVGTSKNKWKKIFKKVTHTLSHENKASYLEKIRIGLGFVIMYECIFV